MRALEGSRQPHLQSRAGAEAFKLDGQGSGKSKEKGGSGAGGEAKGSGKAKPMTITPPDEVDEERGELSPPAVSGPGLGPAEEKGEGEAQAQDGGSAQAGRA